MPPVVQKQVKNSAQSASPTIPEEAWPDSNIKAMFYGESGTGKTTLWSTFPGPILVAIISGSKRSGELRSINTKEMREKIDPLKIESTSHMKFFCKEAASRKYKTVVLDHVSGLADLVLKEILGLDKMPEQKSWGLATRQDYGQCTAQCKEICRALLDVDANCVIIGQERMTDPKEDMPQGSDLLDGITPKIGVDVVPSLARWLNPTVDYNIQCFKRPKTITKKVVVGGKEIITQVKTREIEYCIRLADHEVVTTKVRVPRGSYKPAVIVDPSYDKLIRVIDGTAKPEDYK